VAWRTGDLALAENQFRKALKACGESGDPLTPIEILLDLSDMAASHGNIQQSNADGLQAFSRIAELNSFGPGMPGNSFYAGRVFHRISFATGLLPGFLRPDMSQNLPNRLITLAVRLESSGQAADACRIYRRVLDFMPDESFAQPGLANTCK
jgi:hypothetical protein